MSAFYVIGVDPGPKKCGWAVIWYERSAASTARYVTGGMVESHVNAFATTLFGANANAVVAVETPSGYVHEHARGAQLLATARVAGELVGVAKANGRHVIELSPETWRRALTGKTTASDATIKRAVGFHVTEMPKRSNSHTRDAIGVAIVGASKFAREQAFARQVSA